MKAAFFLLPGCRWPCCCAGGSGAARLRVGGGLPEGYLNDEDMKLANKPVETPETNFESYREGAGGANGGKVGGGCGCN